MDFWHALVWLVLKLAFLFTYVVFLSFGLKLSLAIKFVKLVSNF